MSAPDFPSQPSTGTELDGRIRRDAADDAARLADTAREDIGELASGLKEEAAAIGEEAKEQIAAVAEKAKGMAEDQKQLVVDQLSGVSSALDKVAGELESQGEGTAHYVRMIADGADKLTSTVRSNSVDDMLAMAQDFGRQQPVAFMGAAALLGFVASRFLVASASRQADRNAPAQQPAATSPSYSAMSRPQPMGGENAGI